MKLGIIRCMQTEDYCPGSRDFRTIRERKGAFMGEDDIQLVGFINCGGCPGKKRCYVLVLWLNKVLTPLLLLPVSAKGLPLVTHVLSPNVCKT